MSNIAGSDFTTNDGAGDDFTFVNHVRDDDDVEATLRAKK